MLLTFGPGLMVFHVDKLMRKYVIAHVINLPSDSHDQQHNKKYVSELTGKMRST